MRCPWCIAEGERSTLTPECGAVTCMGWSPHYDEDGVYHTHDPNGRTNLMLCSRGHRWSAGYSPCASCDWGKQEARLVEVRCAGSGVTPPIADSPQRCPECGQDVPVVGVWDLGATHRTTYSLGHHFIRTEGEDALPPVSTNGGSDVRSEGAQR